LRRLKRIHLGLILLATAVLAAVAVGSWVRSHFCQLTLEDVAGGKVFRSAQPSADDLRGWVDRYHIRTVINLRGDFSSHQVQQEAKLAEGLHVDFLAFDLAAWKLPRKKTMLSLIDSLEKARTPILVHCRQGMDRSGLVTMLAAWAVGGQEYAAARRQLYFPIIRDEDEPHISDMIIHYEQYCEREHLACGDWARFKAWVRDHYQGRGEED